MTSHWWRCVVTHKSALNLPAWQIILQSLIWIKSDLHLIYNLRCIRTNFSIIRTDQSISELLYLQVYNCHPIFFFFFFEVREIILIYIFSFRSIQQWFLIGMQTHLVCFKFVYFSTCSNLPNEIVELNYLFLKSTMYLVLKEFYQL